MSSEQPTTTQTRDPRTVMTTTARVHGSNMVQTSGQGCTNQEMTCQEPEMIRENYFHSIEYPFGQQQASAATNNNNQLATSQDATRIASPTLQMAFQAVMQANHAPTNQTAQNLLQSEQTTTQENSNMVHFLSGMLQERQNQLARERTRGIETERANSFSNQAAAQRTIAEQERVIQEQNNINEQAKSVQSQQQYSIQQILFYLQQSQVHTLNYLHANMKPKSHQGKYR